MTPGTATIRRLIERDISQVVVTHLAAFPGFLMSTLGSRFLGHYYANLLAAPGSIFLGCFDDTGQLMGFACGTAAPAVLYRQLGRRVVSLAIAAAWGALTHPLLWPRLVLSVVRVFRGGGEKVPVPGEYAELTSIAVGPEFAGRGLGAALLEAFCEQAATAGAEGVFLTTDKRENDAVNRFYLRNGFSVSGEVYRGSGRYLNQMTKPLSNAASGTRE